MPPKRVHPLQFLSSTRLVVVAGKGGVGKTTVTAVLARAAFRAGMRVLAVDLDGKPTLADLLPDQPSESISAKAALAEYLETHGLHRVAKRLATSGVIDVVANAAPGIDDIVVLGKLKQLERSEDFDVILVDGPAAGHAITLLLAPASLQAAVRGGPIRTQAEEVADMLADHQRCQACLVTLPEATPIAEALETAAALRDRVGVRLGPMVVNAVDLGTKLDEQAGGGGSAMARAAVFTNARRAMHAAQARALDESWGGTHLTVPLVDGATLDAAEVDRLAAAIVGGR